MESGSKNHTIYGFGDLIPYWQSKWTLWVTQVIHGLAMMQSTAETGSFTGRSTSASRKSRLGETADRVPRDECMDASIGTNILVEKTMDQLTSQSANQQPKQIAK